MTMNPHTTANALRSELRAARASAQPTKTAKRTITPAALASAGFILAVTLIARVFYK